MFVLPCHKQEKWVASSNQSQHYMVVFSIITHIVCECEFDLNIDKGLQRWLKAWKEEWKCLTITTESAISPIRADWALKDELVDTEAKVLVFFSKSRLQNNTVLHWP